MYKPGEVVIYRAFPSDVGREVEVRNAAFAGSTKHHQYYLVNTAITITPFIAYPKQLTALPDGRTRVSWKGLEDIWVPGETKAKPSKGNSSDPGVYY